MSEGAFACNVPVFRYALENWPSGLYVFFALSENGQYDESAKQAIDFLKSARQNSIIEFKELNLSASNETGDLEKIVMKNTAGKKLPALFVFYPSDSPMPEDFLSYDLTLENAMRIINSPMREEIAGKILSGATAVWVLAKGADPEKNRKIASTIEEILKLQEKDLKLSDMMPGETVDDIHTASKIEIKISLPYVEIDQNDPREKLFIEMVRHLNPEIKEGEIFAFPLFGRGRLLSVFGEKNIDSRNLDDVGSFLSGACSCMVKSQNPGIDLLFAVDWDKLVFEGVSKDLKTEKITLTGFDEFIKVENHESSDSIPATDNVPEIKIVLQSEPTQDGTNAPPPEIGLMKIAGLVVVNIVGLSLIFYFFLNKRNPST